MKWIKCRDRLPPLDTCVIATDGYSVAEGYRTKHPSGAYSWMFKNCSNSFFSHWMLLPSLVKDDEFINEQKMKAHKKFEHTVKKFDEGLRELRNIGEAKDYRPSASD